MVYKLHKNGAYNIHTIKTERFKNIQIEVIFRNNIDRKRVAKRTLLFDMLLENNESYKTKRDIILKQEELYNAVLYDITYKLGNEVLTSVALDLLNPKYAEETYLSEALKFFFDLIFKPNVKDCEFDRETLDTIRTRLISDIKCIKENPTRYSALEAMDAMDPESVSSIRMLGTIEDLEAITPQNLYQEYLDILEHDYVDIYIIGDIDEDEIISLINENVKLKTIKSHELTYEVSNKTRKKPKEVSEKSNFEQTHIVCIHNIEGLTPYEKRYVANVYDMILGGGGLETKLFHYLRDEHSLCYGVRSTYMKYEHLVVINTSVDTGNTDLAIKLIKKAVNDMLTKVTDEEVNNAISSCISSIKMMLDSPGKIIDEYLFRNITDLEDLETRIETYKKVTKEEVMKLAKKVMLNTIYVLEGGGNDEN